MPYNYRAKGGAIEAVQVTQEWFDCEELSGLNLPKWLIDAYYDGTIILYYGDEVLVNIPEGELTAFVGDYILNCEEGRLYVLSQDVFELLYEDTDTIYM